MHKRRLIYPDKNSWLSEALVSFFKSFQNEYFLSLWDALNEYVEYHNHTCAYLGGEYSGPLELYPEIEYDEKARTAILKKMYFLSTKAEVIIKHNYLKAPKVDQNKGIFSSLLSKKSASLEEEYPHLDFMVLHNNMEPAAAKEILLKTSYDRHDLKKLFVLENEAKGIEYKSINVVKITFDLNFLNDCSFLSVTRYASFRQILPPDLILSIAVKIDFDIPDLPRHLKESQLIYVSSTGNQFTKIKSLI